MKARLYYLDHLKIFLIFLVIMHHVGQGYGPSGGFWFYTTSNPEKLEWMGRFFAVNASFFMGLFFMISGYFFAPSFERKGLKQYVIDKFIRYGIPLIFAWWILMPFIFYFNYELYSNNPSLPFFTFFQKIYLGIGEQPAWFEPILSWPESELGFGHMWFVENLLVYAIIYGFLRVIFQKTSLFERFNLNVYLFTFLYIVIVTGATILVRDYYRVGDIQNVFGFLMIEVAHWPQYLGFLVSGIIASQTDLFQKFPTNYGKGLLALGLLMAAKIYFPSFFPDFFNFIAGKYFEVYETVLGFSVSFGLIVLFRGHFNTTNKLFKVMSENAYAAYIFHYPIVIAVQFVFDKVPLNTLPKFIIVGVLSIIITFLASYVIRKPVLVRKVL